MKISLIVERLTGPLACLLFFFAVTETSVAQTVLFIRGADRSGGFLEADDDAERTEQLADINNASTANGNHGCLLYTSPSPRDRTRSRMPSSA